MLTEEELPAPPGWRIVWLGRVAYGPMLAWQEALVAAKIADPTRTPDTLLLLEHEPVYTIGRTPDRSSLSAPETLPYPVETIHRGGQATYHGPGQLIGYPIINLTARARDLHRYLRVLEEVLILTLATFGVAGERRGGLTGVWLGPQKIASIGVGVRRWITLHGFALNVSGGAALQPYTAITPCGLEGVTMTALESQTRQPTTVRAVAETLASLFPPVLDARLPLNHVAASEPPHQEQNN